MNELISRKEAIRAIENIVAVGTFVEGMKEKCLRAVKDVPVIEYEQKQSHYFCSYYGQKIDRSDTE